MSIVPIRSLRHIAGPLGPTSIMKNDLINTEIEFNFNPFGGLNKEEIQQAIVSDFDFDSIIELVNSKEPKIIQLVGKKGRGKTLHLKLLGQILKQYPIFFLDNVRFGFKKLKISFLYGKKG